MDFKKIKSWFTLVELIIVITVLAILATIAFVSFQSYTANARDSVRAVNLKDLSKAIELHKISTGKFPKPWDVYATWQLLWTNLFTVWKINSDLSKLLKFSKIPVDPVSWSEYLYWLNYNNKYFEVAGTFESQQTSFFVWKAHADIWKYFSRIEWNYKGLMLFSTGSQQYIANVPSLIFSREWTYELIGNEVYFITHNWKNFAYSVDWQTTIQNQTVEEVLAQKTWKNVQVDYLDVQDWGNDSDQFVDRLWYQKDLIGFEIFWKSYEPTWEWNTWVISPGSPLLFQDIDAWKYHACWVWMNGFVYCWWAWGEKKGLNYNKFSYYPIKVPNLMNVAKVSTWDFSTCVLMSNGTIKCFWQNEGWILWSNNLDENFTTAIPVDVAWWINNAVDIKVWQSHACALLNDETMRCWWANGYWQLWDGTTINRYVPVSVWLNWVKQISLWIDHTCALLSDKTVKCWGANWYWELWGNFPENSGVNYNTPQSVYQLTNVILISWSWKSNCALLSDKTVKCWGNNEDWQLWDGTTTNRIAPVLMQNVNNVKNISAWAYSTIIHTWDNKIFKFDRDILAMKEVLTLSGKEFSQISEWYKATCARQNSWNTYCWWWNWYWWVWINSEEEVIESPTLLPYVNHEANVSQLFLKISTWKSHSCWISREWSVYCWGDNSFWQLWDGTNNQSNKPVKVSWNHIATWIKSWDNYTCIWENNWVFCWWQNNKWQLWDGTNIDKNVPQFLQWDRSWNYILWANYMCYQSNNWSVQCWGDNSYWQLWDGTNIDKNTPTNISFQWELYGMSWWKNFLCWSKSWNWWIYCWWKNDKWQLWDWTVVNRNVPTLITETFNLPDLYIDIWNDFWCYTSYDEEWNGWTKCWWDNSFWQYWNGDTVSSFTPVSQVWILEGYYSQIFQNTMRIFSDENPQEYIVWDNSFWQYANNSNVSYTTFSPVSKVEYIDFSFWETHWCWILVDWKIKCWWQNDKWQLWNGSNVSSVTSVFVKTE